MSTIGKAEPQIAGQKLCRNSFGNFDRLVAEDYSGRIAGPTWSLTASTFIFLTESIKINSLL